MLPSNCRKLTYSPALSMASTAMRAVVPSTETLVEKSPVCTLRSAHSTICPQKRPYPPHPIHSEAHFDVASEVKATVRPRPYCQCARSGSAFPVTSGVSAMGRGVVMT